MSEFAGAHVIVTGASSGIGLATAQLLAKRGARVFLIARSSERLEAAVAAIRGVAGEAAWAAADVSDRAALLAALAAAERAFGPAAGLFANAGTGGRFAPLAEYDDALFETMLRTNLTSAFWAVKHVLPGMLARRAGSILLTGSLASERGMPMNVGYVVSKHALLGLARAAAVEAAAAGVRVNCLIPGLIETPMLMQLGLGATAEEVRARLGASVPMGHIGSAEETAELACFLLSARASHVTAQAIGVDGGILGTLIPR